MLKMFDVYRFTKIFKFGFAMNILSKYPKIFESF